MRYIKIFCKFHFKYWYIYLFSLFLFMPAFVFSVLFSVMIASYGLDSQIAWETVYFNGGLILSSPIFFISYKIASEAKKIGISKMPIWLLIVLNHLPIYIAFTLLYKLLFYFF